MTMKPSEPEKKKATRKKSINKNAIGSSSNVNKKTKYSGALPYNINPYLYITPWERSKIMEAQSRDVVLRAKLMKENPDKYFPPVGKVATKYPEWSNIRFVNDYGAMTNPTDTVAYRGYGDENPVTLQEFMNAPKDVQDAYKLPQLQKFADGGSPNISGLTQFTSDQISNILSSYLQSQASKNLNQEANIDPSIGLRKQANQEIGGNIASSTLQGAALGTAVAPGIGTLIGGGIGLLSSGLSAVLGTGARRDAQNQASQDWYNKMTDITRSNLKTYSTGGKVKGKGTSKSDSNFATLDENSFVVPAENSKQAIEIGKEYLGWTGNETALKRGGDVPVLLSKGEVVFTPEERSILEIYGIDLGKLAPNAKSKSAMKDGGLSRKKDYGSKKKPYPSVKSNQFAGKNRSYPIPTKADAIDALRLAGLHGRSDIRAKVFKKYPGLKKKADGGLVKLSDGYDPEARPTDKLNKYYSSNKSKIENKGTIWDYVPELAGALQMAGGVAGLISAGKEPDLEVSGALRNLSTQVHKLSQYGYEPRVINELMNQIERTRRDVSKAAIERGGSPQQVMGRLNTLLSTTIDKKAGLLFADAKEKARKFSDVMKVDMAKANQEYDINKVKLSQWYKNQEAWGNMLQSGIANIIGARQLKDQLRTQREIGNSSPTITF